MRIDKTLLKWALLKFKWAWYNIFNEWGRGHEGRTYFCFNPPLDIHTSFTPNTHNYVYRNSPPIFLNITQLILLAL